MALIMLVIIGLMPCVLLFFHLVFIKVAMIIRKNCLPLVYVDDCLLFVKTYTVLDETVAALEKEFILTSRAPLVPTLG